MNQDPSWREESLAMFRRLYPELSDEEISDAKERLDAYVDLVRRIYERLEEDPEAYAKFRKELEERRRRGEETEEF